jgi:hypothetical protein
MCKQENLFPAVSTAKYFKVLVVIRDLTYFELLKEGILPFNVVL